ncbi:ankyrin repeat-containing domain protein [Aspergillus crustosus]
MCSFLELPEDIHLYICKHFLYPRHINNLLRTCRILHQLLNPGLWRPMVASIGGNEKPLLTAATSGNLALVQKLADYHDMDAARTEIHQAIGAAAQEGHYPVVYYLLTLTKGVVSHYEEERRDDPPAFSWTPSQPSLLQTAARHGELELVRLLLDHDAAALDKVKALEIAVKEGKEDIVNVLLHPGDPTFLEIYSAASRLPLLQSAIRIKRKSLVMKLLELGFDINLNDPDRNETPLKAAVEARWLWAVEILLSRGASVKSVDHHGNTALHVATNDRDTGEKLEIVRLLLRYGSDLASRNNSACTPVDLAITCQRLDLIFLMAATGFALNKVENKSRLLCLAVTNGDKELAAEMIWLGASLNTPQTVGVNMWAPLHHAAFENQIDMMDLLVSNGASLDPFMDDELPTPLHLALGRGHLDAAQWLLDEGADLNRLSNRLHPWVSLDSTFKTRWTSLHFAAIGGRPTFNLVLRHGYRVSWKDSRYVSLWEVAFYRPGNTDSSFLQLVYNSCCDEGKYLDPIHPNRHLFRTVHSVKKSVIDFVLSLGSINLHKTYYNGQTILHQVAKHTNLDALQALLRHGAPIDSADNYGNTALFYAAQKRDADTVRILLESGATIPLEVSRDNDPVRACLLSAYYSRNSEETMRDTLEVLIKHGADLNSVMDKRTYFQDLIILDSTVQLPKYVVQVLLDHGADPDGLDGHGMNVLHYAAYLGDTETVAVLLRHGTNIYAKNTDGKTPAQIADDLGWHWIVDMFMRRAAGLEIVYLDE